ncbi:MAG: redoxin domain-containing protein [Thermoguttaceae bacterium]|nr:redoxin domain-containing protein [Thermoguttaceae bacterium]MDW8037368.1 redoxin domain-containing protein [Thermoguttaceae bacterium]
MVVKSFGQCWLEILLGGWMMIGTVGHLLAATPPIEQALRLVPVQKGVEYDRPTPEEAAKCVISPVKEGKLSGWIVQDSNGTLLRRFIDTNGDNLVDIWAYYKDGLEVYRDIDANYNGKADQYRWFHTAGTRWGLDLNEDGQIDVWKMISPEEVAAELVAAIAQRDVGRFLRLALSPEELRSLGLGPVQERALAERLATLRERFEKLLAQQNLLDPTARWVQFLGHQPGLVPAGTQGSSRDLRVYENALAIAESGGKHVQINIGTLIEVGQAWRIIDLPQLGEDQAAAVAGGIFFRPATAPAVRPTTPGGASEQFQKLLAELEKIDQALGQAQRPEEKASLHAQRANLLEQIAQQADNPQDRHLWYKQLADTVGAAVQTGEYPKGVERLATLYEKLKKTQDIDIAAYVRFRQLTAEYGLALQNPKADFAKLQAQWLKTLEEFIGQYPNSPDTAEAMLQLAMGHEFAGQETEALKWYSDLATKFPQTHAGRKAAGASRRLQSVGKLLELAGKGLSEAQVDLAQYRGRIVLVHFWASWCEPCKADLPTLKDLLERYGKAGFSIVGVNLDNSPEEAIQFVQEHRLNWPHIHEPGGLESRPATELGILTLPTMFLIGTDGKVIHRDIRASQLDRELRQLTADKLPAALKP